MRVDVSLEPCPLAGKKQNFSEIFGGVKWQVSEIRSNPAADRDNPLFVPFAGNNQDSARPVDIGKRQVAGLLGAKAEIIHCGKDASFLSRD